MRTGHGLPFVCTLYMQLILEGIVARVQRDLKVIINHFVWMANHAHIIVEARDAQQCTRFYGEVQKQLTEAVKRLLGREHLSLWRSNETSVMHLGDRESVMRRIAYLYANPARAGLVNAIEQYPGVSSWSGFQGVAADLKATISKECPWVQAPMIPRLPARSVTERQDLRLCAMMRERVRHKHELKLQPNSWMERFGVTTTQEIGQVNRSIIAMVREHEEAARVERQSMNRKVVGVNKLRREPLTMDYRPKRDTRRLFVHAEDKALRIQMIKRYKDFCDRCRECYERWKLGDFTVVWPPGAFRPPQPSNANWYGP